MHRMLALGLGLLLASVAVSDDTRKEYEQRLASLSQDDAIAQYRLSLWCQEKGLKIEARRHQRIVVTLQPDHRAARRALGFEKVHGRWVAGKDKMRAKGFVKHDGVWLTPEEYRHYAADEVAEAEAKAARRVGNQAIKMAWRKDPRERQRAMGMIEQIDAKHRLRPLAIAARINYPDVRMQAVKGLGALNSEDSLPPLYKRAIFDRDESIRKAAVEAIKQIDAKGKIGPFVRALGSSFDTVRLHAVQALGALGDTAAVGPLVARYSVGGGSGQAVYLAQTTQVSYVQDFDVEVAQTSFIADPVIGVVQDGIVHAFRTLSINGFYEVYEKPALADALGALTGKDFGQHPEKWVEWYKAEQQAKLRERQRRQHERVSGS
ncbi:MAG: HEAT repeat domain-containing protein [Planctomycetota bacterium]